MTPSTLPGALLSLSLLLPTARAQAPDAAPPPPLTTLGHVVYGPPDGDAVRATGRDWKACFDRTGFTFVPFLGAEAPRNFPLRFELCAVRVGGEPLALLGTAAPRRCGDRVVFDRGAVQERYDLAMPHVEQTFVVDSDLAGDVEVELAVHGELREDPARPGLQFTNELGGVAYGDAFLVRGGARLPIATEWTGARIVLRVPASLRDGGPVVIDPLLNTQVALHGLFTQNRNPDLAYDATNQAWLVVWDTPWSLTDTDVYSQMLDRFGYRIDGSGRAIDNSSVVVDRPRVANRSDVDRFLVVAQRSDITVALGRRQVWGVVRDAAPAGNTLPGRVFSDPVLTTEATMPDVGGDPDPTAGALWQVVWRQGTGTIRTRSIDAAGAPLATGQETARRSETFSGLRISKSNGRGQVNTPGWLVVWAMRMSRGDHDIVAQPILANGTVGQPYSIETSTNDDVTPSVTSPIVGPRRSFPQHVVTFERQTPPTPMAIVYEPFQQYLNGTHDLSPLGIGPFWLRAETDGLRYTFLSSHDGATISLAMAVFAPGPSTFTLQDGPHALPGAPYQPQIASRGASGGGLTEYGVAFVDRARPPELTTMTLYAGHGAGTIYHYLPTACDGVLLGMQSQPFLGATVSFPFYAHGSGVPVIALGFLASNASTLCGTCGIGLRQDLPVSVSFGSQYDLTIPAQPELVGTTLAAQGFVFGGGPCLGGVATSDTMGFTIR